MCMDSMGQCMERMGKVAGATSEVSGASPEVTCKVPFNPEPLRNVLQGTT